MSTSGKDLRSFLEQVSHRMGIVRKAVDVKTEIGELCSQSDDPLLFEHLSHHDDFRLVDRLLGDRELQSIALGCEPAAVIPHYAAQTAAGPGPTETVNGGPVKDIVWTGHGASLYKLPVPIPSEGIDVPHLDLKPKDFQSPVISGSVAMTRHPESRVHNCFFTMAKVVGEQRAQCYIFSPHTWQNIAAWGERGERAPMALVIGCHPAVELGAAYTGPHPGFSELQVAAGLLGEPIPLVECETVDLQVPANAEIVIEGFIDPETAPYLCTAAHTDTHAPFFSEEPFFDVTGITMRGEPIYRHIQPTRFTDHHAICEFIIAPMLFNVLQAKGINVHDVHVPLRSALNCGVIQMTASVKEEVREALQTGMTNPFFPRLTVAVDQDVDIYDVNDLLYALSIRVDPATDIHTLEGIRSFNLEPQSTKIPGLPPEALLRSGSRYGIDATKPPVTDPAERIQFERLTARGHGRVRLQDYLDD
ncbi:MAG: UbiD family decarboxylase [Gammaproteobacteria bacterium]|nr:UbiD family decarboxylase [Gammaproteobacteria bacterium]